MLIVDEFPFVVISNLLLILGAVILSVWAIRRQRLSTTGLQKQQTAIRKNHAFGTKPFLGHETVIAFVVETSIVIVFFWVRSSGFARIALIFGTIVSLGILLSPFLELSPMGLRKYQSRLHATPVDMGGARGDSSVIAREGVAAGPGGVAIGGDLHGNVTIQNMRSLRANDVYFATLIWVLCLSALPVILIPLVALLLILSDAGIAVLVGLLFLAPSTLLYLIRIRPTTVDAWLKIAQHALEQIALQQPLIRKAVTYGSAAVMLLAGFMLLLGFVPLAENFRHAVGWKLLFSNEVQFPLSGYASKAIEEEGKGNYGTAVEYYKMAIRADSNDAAAYNGLAWLYAETMDTNYDEAVYLAQKAVKLVENLDPADNPYYTVWKANYLDTLGWAYYKSGDCSNALLNLEKSVRLSPAQEFTAHLETVRAESLAAPSSESPRCTH